MLARPHGLWTPITNSGPARRGNIRNAPVPSYECVLGKATQSGSRQDAGRAFMANSPRHAR
eukprot:610594-Alexandrium_andersonii.AAC.1